jgi:TonB-dependent starch-binding outer membrane protein SusC
MKTIYNTLFLFLFLLPFTMLAQSTLDGTVVDQKTKQPIPGVNVLVQGLPGGTQTDFDGKFKLSNVKNGDKVVFSYIGYKNQIIGYNGQNSVTVSLEEDSNELKEVVVQVGYGSVKKKDATGSVALITAKDFNKGAITSVDGLLNGRAAGVVVTSSGTPGDDGNIRIRGGSSLLASNDPLIVVDGLPLDGKGGLSAINPNDIESFSVLKDASATAIYGNRGSNGVILITTKKGSKKEMQIFVNTFTTLNTLAKKIEVYSANDYRALINKVAPEKANLLGNSNTDWQKEIFNNSFSSDANVSILGNLLKTVPTRLSLGNTSNNGILETSRYNRTTGSIALNPSFFDNHLKFNVTGTYSYTFRRKANEDAIKNSISFDPTQSVFTPNSFFNGYTEAFSGPASNPTGTRGSANPVSLLRDKREITNSKRFFGNFNLDYKFHFLPELRAIINLGIDKLEGTEFITVNPLSRSGFNSDLIGNKQVGEYREKWFDDRNKNLNAQLNYTKSFTNINVDLLGGYEYQQFEKEKFDSGNFNRYGLGVNEELNADVTTDPGNKLKSYFGRLNLGFYDKYLLTVNFRRDGSTRISPLNKWANFTGVALAWKIKEEGFLKNSNVINDLKLRVGYGQTGQQNLPDAYAWIKRYSTSGNLSYQFGDGFVTLSKPEGYNQNLKWERSTKYNVGLDFAFSNNKLKGALDGYFTETNDLFSQTNQGALQNLNIFGPRNIGSLESKGVELSLNYEAIQKDNFDLNFNYNFTYNKLELTNLFSDGLQVGGVGLGGFVQTHRVGYAPFSYWVYEQIYDANSKPIEGAFVDRNNDGEITSDDKYNYKKPQADFTMSLMTNATFYKNWDFSMAWRASFGNYVYDRVSSDRAVLSSINNLVDNTIGNAPLDYNDTNFRFTSKESDYYIKDGTFLKLDNVTLGYNFRKFLGDKHSLRVYTGVQNALIITKYKNLDPEVFNDGIDETIFPRSRMFLLGINANF